MAQVEMSDRGPDRDLASIQEARALASRAKVASREIVEFSQERIDRIVDEMAAAAQAEAEPLARLAVKETGYGVVADKIKKNLGNIGEHKLLLITAIKMVDDYFDLFKKVKNTKNDFEKLSIRFKELRSLAIKYKEEKEIEIGKLKNELDDFKEIIEKSKNSYEEILDKTTKSIEKFIENTETDQEKNVQ